MKTRHIFLKAFSLVELSIVLVILGLLVGGVIAGQSLIRAAELRKTITETDKFITSLRAFQDRYFGLPGDINNAYSFWTTRCNSNDSICNGNADGAWNPWEARGALNHLANAGLISGTYNLDRASGSDYTSPWRVGNTMLTVTTDTGIVPDSTGYTGYTTPSGTKTGNYIKVSGDGGGTQTNINSLYNTSGYGVFNTDEAWSIDQKVDDGHGRTGRVFGYGSPTGTNTSPNCTSIYNASPAGTYRLTDPGKICYLFFWL